MGKSRIDHYSELNHKQLGPGSLGHYLTMSHYYYELDDKWSLHEVLDEILYQNKIP